MIRAESTRKPVAPLLAYIVLFHATWAVWLYAIYPWMERLGNTTLRYALVNIGLRLLIWVLPVFLYLRYVDHVEPIAYLKLRHRWKRGVLVGVTLTGINALLSVLRFGVPHLTIEAITWNSVLSTSLFIGFVEEIPYRGFILQQIQERSSFWVANLLTSLLFVGIHIPGWIAFDLVRLETVVFVFVFGSVLAVVFHYSQSLWSAIVTHSLNDFLAGIVFRL